MRWLALAIALIAGPAAAQTTLSPPVVIWGSGPVVAPQPVSVVTWDSSSHAPCIVGSSATCVLGASGGGNDAPGSGFTLMPTDGATYTAGRWFQASCSATGNVLITASDGSQSTVLLAQGVSALPYAITSWTLTGVTGPATCVYSNVK